MAPSIFVKDDERLFLLVWDEHGRIPNSRSVTTEHHDRKLPGLAPVVASPACSQLLHQDHTGSV